MANRNWASAGRLYSMHVKPVLLDCNFIVDSTNGNGLGIRSLKGPIISNVYMHTSATPAAGNPQPASGIIVVEFQNNFNRYLGGFSGQASPLSSSVTSITSNTAYVLTSAGTATAAQLLAAGIPQGNITAALLQPSGLASLVGLGFIAAESATIGGGATAAPSVATGSGIDHIEVLGDPNVAMMSNPQGSGQIILQCFSGTTLTAPANGSVIQLSFYMDDSSVFIAGE